MERRDFLKSVPAGMAVLSSAFSVSSCRRHSGFARPNVVLIITDDQGYGDFGFTGNPVIRTPHIDALAQKSASMSRFYVSPVCSPTRASLMTGRYNYRTRCIDTFLGRSMMDPEEVTVAEILSNAGYATGIFGKWHLGDHYPMRAQDQGFEEVLVHRGGGIGQPGDPPGGEGKYTDPVLFHNGDKIQERGYCTDVYFDRGLEWMEEIHASGQNFFLYLAPNAPHGPFHDVPPELYEEYRKRDLTNARFPQDRGHKLPEQTDTDAVARIYAMITNIDDNVGKLIKRLDRLGILDNTLILYLVDNGPATRRYVAGFQGMKSGVHEGGIRSPLLVHWPAAIRAGTPSGRIAAHIDILPTILDACRVPLPRNLKIDGRSLLPLLEDRPTNWPDRRIVIQSHRGDRPVLYHHFAICGQRWKMLHPSGFGRETFEGPLDFELYDMLNDPFETKDISAEMTEVVGELKKAYERWFEDVGGTRPDNYAPPRIHIGTPYENPLVLTRQDWRSKGPWTAEESMGYWMLRALGPGQYDIRVRFLRPVGPGEAVLEVSDRTIKVNVADAESEITFPKIDLGTGNLNLQARFESIRKTLGSWQVEVLRK